MADIVKSDQRQLAKARPLRKIRDLFRWPPFREMAPIFQGFPVFARDEWNPSFDVTEGNDAYLFKADVPGVKKEDLEISTTGNRLQISGKREAEKDTKSNTVYTYEREFGSFVRSFMLPEGADLEHARSELKDGVLTLAIPKPPAAQPKTIPISTTAAS